jgi:hypothetical protein
MVFLKAQLAGDEDIMRDAMSQLTSKHAMDRIVPLLHETFVIATRIWFGAEFTRSDVIHLVARVRASLGEQSGLVGPVAAESEIRRTPGENVPLFVQAVEEVGPLLLGQQVSEGGWVAAAQRGPVEVVGDEEFSRCLVTSGDLRGGVGTNKERRW